MMARLPGAPRILVIRRDNIGDLVCTTPLLHALRERFPSAWIGVLANRYNATVLDGNPDIDEVIVYEKAKHRSPGQSRWQIWLRTFSTLMKLRRRGVDLALLASPGGEHFARWTGARQILSSKGHQGHEVERCLQLLAPFGEVPPGSAVRVIPDARATLQLRDLLETARQRHPVVGIHLSARKVSQRWPEQRFVALAKTLLDSGRAGHILLFWAPGKESNALHPGDDEKAERVLAALDGLPVTPVQTTSLAHLIAGLSLCDRVICADGGAMHLAAGLGKPIVCFFGKSDAEQWRPWAVPHELLQTETADVSDISVEAALAAWDRLPAQ